MNNRERTLAVLNYQGYERLPLVHFGYWTETLVKWAEEGHITKVKVIIGGTPVTEAFARQVGADGYAPDANRAVSVAGSLLA